jgi:hypothetical protein
MFLHGSRRPWLNLMLAASNAQRAEIFCSREGPRQPFLIRSGARVPQMIHKWWAAAVPCPSESRPARGERYVRKSGSPSGSRWRWEPPVPPPDKNHDTGKPCLCWVESGRRWHRVAAGDRSRFGFHFAAGQLPVTELAFHKFWGDPQPASGNVIPACRSSQLGAFPAAQDQRPVARWRSEAAMGRRHVKPRPHPATISPSCTSRLSFSASIFPASTKMPCERARLLSTYGRAVGMVVRMPSFYD